ncbi:MAG: hypothetical protein R3D58_13405 [Saprospiraceae bacterium]|nr:hypothetical protein [Lewinellaceae bacterium]
MTEKNEYIELIKDYLTNRAVAFSIVRENFHGPFWYLKLQIKEYDVTISGDIGFEVKIKFKDEELPLWKIDRSLINHGKTSPQNIEKQLEVLLTYISHNA